MSNIGLMEGAFFVGRKEIVDWINATLDINIQKVEDTASGAISCQLLDMIYPGQVPMSKINWGAKQSFEFVANYKILQTCFTKLHIDKFVDVDRLISGKYMDNLEFMQWFKRYYELTLAEPRVGYDCRAQRMKGKGWETVPVTSKGKSSAGSSQRSAPAITSAAVKQPAFSARVAPVISSAKSANATKTAPVVPKENQAPKASTAASRAANNVSKVNPSINATVSSTKYEEEIQSLKATIEEQDSVTSDLRLEVEVVQKERDFYFEKLRDIEVLLQQIEDEGRGDKTTAAILKILYATADGFEPVVNPIESEDQATEPYQEPYTKPYTEPYSEPFSEAENLEVEPIALEQESY